MSQPFQHDFKLLVVAMQAIPCPGKRGIYFAAEGRDEERRAVPGTGGPC